MLKFDYFLYCKANDFPTNMHSRYNPFSSLGLYACICDLLHLSSFLNNQNCQNNTKNQIPKFKYSSVAVCSLNFIKHEMIK